VGGAVPDADSALPAGSICAAGGAGGGGGEAGGGAAGVATSLERGARSTGASIPSPGPSRYGFGSPCSAAGRAVRGPRPRRGGRRRSFMQVLSVRVNARESRAGVLAEKLDANAPSASSRTECVFAGMPRGMRRRQIVDDGYRATRLVLCLDRLPARIPHAVSGNGPTRGRGARSRLVYPFSRGHWSGRASMLGRSTRSAVVPTDATSMANSSDKRNPLRRAANFMPTDRPPIPIVRLSPDERSRYGPRSARASASGCIPE
jgi:hypothetical protein